MELKIGHIYWFRYHAYQHDPTPLVLILWPGNKRTFETAKPMHLMHGLNLNYLKAGIADDVYRMIAQIATKTLTSNTQKLYDEYLRMLPATRIAYRTYNPEKISGAKLVSAGWKESLSFINKFKKKEQIEAQIVKLVHSKVIAAKNVTKIIKETKSLGKITADEAEARARQYLSAIAKVKRPEVLDPSKYTMLFGTSIKKSMKP